MDLLFWFSGVVFALTAAIVADSVLGWRKLRRLADIPPALPTPPPTLAIVVPARNEASTIEPALRSILALDYPALEVTAIDDRSTDDTGAILDRLGAGFQTLRVLHVRELPTGWLGKNHAMHVGASSTNAEYVLFADADVHFEPSALRRAVAECEARRLDHLTVLPDIPMRSPFMQMGMVGGVLGLLALYRPWRARETGRHSMGVGAFNLVRTSAYRDAGGHETLAMEILDDLELGRLMGRTGRQDLLLGEGMVRVEIYRTPTELFRGIQKNVFTFLGYSAWTLVAATLGTFALTVWPWLGLLVTEGPTRWLNAGSGALSLALHAYFARRFGYSLVGLVTVPFSGLVTIAIFWQVAIRTWIQGGVEWRGTRYPLAKLKRQRRRS